LRTATAWCLAEQLSIRIFPWELGHTQLIFTPFVQIADIGGSALVGFCMLWLAEAGFQIHFRGANRRMMALPAGLLCFIISYGYIRISRYQSLPANPLPVALIQGNVSIKEKHNVKLFEINTARYRKLSLEAAAPGTFIIWPEAVIQEWIPAHLSSAKSDPRVPYFEDKQSSMMIGALSFETQERFFNSALGIRSDGSMVKPYHKMILMPFGEYTPFSKTFPWLAAIHPTPDFTPGSGIEVFNYTSQAANGSQINFTAAPLICYEDIVPSLSKQAVQAGAQLLVNLTNDAWFGKSIAPYQHHLIASFRAIENKRFLLRSTNSGLTAVVNPLGQTVAELPIFEEGVLKTSVVPLSEPTPYNLFVGTWWLWGLGVIWFFGVVRERVKKGSKSPK